VMSTCDNIDILISVPLNKKVDGVFESLGIKEQRGYVLKQNS